MSFTEDLSLFFGDFDIAATWTPSNGDAAQTAQVFLDTEGLTLNVQGFDVMGDDITMIYKATDFVGLAVDDPIAIDGADYRVRRDPQKVEAGAFMVAALGTY